MSKVSKNIKQLRTERGMSQTELAEKLFVTRQAVSSWENGRTQPDIQMLGKLRVIFDVSIEELLYGKNHNTELELQKPSYKGMMITVFSVLSTLLMAVGLVLIFVFTWEQMPEIVRSSLIFLPFIIGTAAGLFCFIKKKDKKAWCEGGAILWCLGTILSYFLAEAVFDFNVPNFFFYAPITVMICAIMYIMRSVTMLPIMYAFGIICSFSSLDGKIWIGGVPIWRKVMYWALTFTVAALVFGAGIYFIKVLKKSDSQSHRATVATWITAVAIPLFLIFEFVNYGEEFAIVITLFSVALTYFILSQRYRENSSPFVLGFIALCGISLFLGVSSYRATIMFSADYSEIVLLSVVSIGAIAAALIHIKGKFQSKIHIAISVVSFLSQLLFTLIIAYEHFERIKNATPFHSEKLMLIEDIYGIVMSVFILIFFSLIIAYGTMNRKLIPINIGFIGFVIQLIYWLIASGLGMLTNGIILLACGVILLLINLKISKAKELSSEQNKTLPNP